MTSMQTTVQAQIGKISRDREPRDGEYRNPEDGLIYCGVCHTPRQIRISLFGREMTPTVLCRCRQEKEEADQAERERQERLRRVERLRANGLQDRTLRDDTFRRDLGYTPEISRAHAYVEHFFELEASAPGLLLWGNVGTGKTFIAGCIANALIDQGIPVLMTNFARLLNTLTGMHPEERNTFIGSLDSYRLLIIDDVGMERGTEFAFEQMFHVIDNRYRARKPLIVTTNLTLRELKNPPDLARERIYGRILERCVPLKVNGHNIRAEKAAGQLEVAKRILGTS